MTEEPWRTTLTAALKQALEREIDYPHAESELAGLSGTQLATLDVVLRQKWSWYSDRYRERAALVKSPTSPYLFVVACHGDGHLRQKALEAFQQVPGKLALCAALIRCDDWVPEVRSAAERLLLTLLMRDSKTTPLEYLDLLWSLRHRARFRETLWTRIESWLKAPTGRELRWQWLFKGPWSVRRWAAELVRQADPERRIELVLVTVSSRCLPVSLWGVAQLPGLDQNEFEMGLRSALNHPAAATRAAAIRISDKVAASVAKPLLMRALFDEARGPRTAAAHQMQQRFEQPAQAIWREALRRGDESTAQAALLGLADIAEADDRPYLETARADPRGIVRAAALRGFWRSRSPDFSDQLRSALADRSRLVVKQAFSIYRRSDESLDRETLRLAIIGAPDRTARLLISGVRLLEKWEALELLVSLAGNAGLSPHSVNEEAQRWLASSNRRFTTASPAQTSAFRTKIQQLAAISNELVWSRILLILSGS